MVFWVTSGTDVLLIQHSEYTADQMLLLPLPAQFTDGIINLSWLEQHSVFVQLSQLPRILQNDNSS